MALKILLADDSMTAQNMGKKILTDAGYEVVAVSNGAAAVKKIAEISPHLCILDIYMPGYTGLEVCEKIKSSSLTARMPVLLTVGKMEPYKPEEGARVRADGVIVKPFEASELLRAVHRFSQRIAGAAQSRPGVPAPAPFTPPPPPPSTPATYERTVKLTREQIQEYIDPNLAGWRGGTTAAEAVKTAAARTEAPGGMPHAPAFPVDTRLGSMKTASTADAMPTFEVPGAVAAAETPAAVAVEAPVAVEETPAVPMEIAVEAAPVAVETVLVPVEAAPIPVESAETVAAPAVETVEVPPVATEPAVSTEEAPAFVVEPAVPTVETPVNTEEAPAAPAETAALSAPVEAPVAAEVPAVEEPAVETAPAAEIAPEAPVASAPVALPGFVDYLIAHAASAVETQAAAEEAPVAAAEVAVETPASPEISAEAPVETAALAEISAEPAPEPAPSLETPAEFAVSAPSDTPHPLETAEVRVETPEVPVEPALQQTAEGVAPTGAGILSDDLRAAREIGYEIPAVDPALEIAPEVAVTVTPDPHFETAQHIQVENATEAALEPTSRAAEAASAVITTDANLAPMEGLIDAVQPLEGGRLIIPEPASEPAIVAEMPVESVASAETCAEVAVTPAESPVTPVGTPAPAADTPQPPASSGKKRKGMRPIPAAPGAETSVAPPAPAKAETVVEPAPAPVETPVAVAPAEAKQEAPAAKADVSEEIAAVLDLLGQTTAALAPTPAQPGVATASAAVEEAPSVVIGAVRVWMAEEVALAESEATLSLEDEMRMADAPKEVAAEAPAEPVAVAEAAPAEPVAIAEPAVVAEPAVAEPEPVAAAVEVAPQPEAAEAAPAEETVREDKNAPQPAMSSDLGASPPDAGASPTQELAAAMAAAFGGALPQEDLARAEETQSISEEVRRFALGDAYKPKPAKGFGGAAIEDPEEKMVSQEKLAAAIGRALDKLKPQLVAEILKELEAMEEEN